MYKTEQTFAKAVSLIGMAIAKVISKLCGPRAALTLPAGRKIRGSKNQEKLLPDESEQVFAEKISVLDMRDMSDAGQDY